MRYQPSAQHECQQGSNNERHLMDRRVSISNDVDFEALDDDVKAITACSEPRFSAPVPSAASPFLHTCPFLALADTTVLSRDRPNGPEPTWTIVICQTEHACTNDSRKASTRRPETFPALTEEAPGKKLEYTPVVRRPSFGKTYTLSERQERIGWSPPDEGPSRGSTHVRGFGMRGADQCICVCARTHLCLCVSMRSLPHFPGSRVRLCLFASMREPKSLLRYARRMATPSRKREREAVIIDTNCVGRGARLVRARSCMGSGAPSREDVSKCAGR